MKTQPNANSNASVLIDLLALACAIVFLAGAGYCFLFGFVPIFQQSLTDDRYATAIAAVIGAAFYLIIWFRQQS